MRDASGRKVWVPGALKGTKAIGWFIEEFGIAQVSMNITDITVTPVHVAYDEVFEKARQRGMYVTGSEIVGVVPLSVLGAFMNVKVNAADLADQEYVLKVLNEGAQIEAEAIRLEAEIIRIVAERLRKSHSFTSGTGRG